MKNMYFVKGIAPVYLQKVEIFQFQIANELYDYLHTY